LLQGDSREAGRLFAESLSIYEEIGDRGGLAASLGGLGRSALAQGDLALAGARLHRALEIASGVRFVSLVLSLLASTGDLLLRAGGTHRGIQLLAHVLNHPGSEEDVREQAQRLLDQQRREMDQDLFASASDQGRNQRLEAVVDAALQDLASMERQGVSLRGREESALPVASQPLVEPLTPRELEVLHLIAGGRTNKQIAGELILSVGTVKYYTSHIYGKLGVASRTQAVARARELGMLD
jgi:DNA-binding NarL/FixJ family response regulator